MFSCFDVEVWYFTPFLILKLRGKHQWVNFKLMCKNGLDSKGNVWFLFPVFTLSYKFSTSFLFSIWFMFSNICIRIGKNKFCFKLVKAKNNIIKYQRKFVDNIVDVINFHSCGFHGDITCTLIRTLYAWSYSLQSKN